MTNFARGYIKYINHLEQINEAAVKDPKSMILEVEDAYHDHVREIAQDITVHHKKVRVVMLAGPSSSGKTTTAHMLQKYLGEFGVKAFIISLDDFYKGTQQAPLLPNGKYDYESVEALDAEKIKKCFSDLTTTGRFFVPKYNFTLGRPEEKEREYIVEKDDIVIVEGIHALNPVFTKQLPHEVCLKLYVSVKQQIKDANGDVISPMDLRLVRRIVRDVQFRGTTPEGTLSMWDSVVHGEDRYIRPYRLTADYTVNTIHLYEPCILRTMAIPMLREIAEDSLHYRKARDLESRLMRFEPVDAALVPETSMIREFIG